MKYRRRELEIAMATVVHELEGYLLHKMAPGMDRLMEERAGRVLNVLSGLGWNLPYITVGFDNVLRRAVLDWSVDGRPLSYADMEDET